MRHVIRRMRCRSRIGRKVRVRDWGEESTFLDIDVRWTMNWRQVWDRFG